MKRIKTPSARMNMRKLCFPLLWAMSCVTAQAADQWTTGAKIGSVYPQANGDVVITLTVNNPACTNAVSPKYYEITLGANGVTAEGLRNMLAVAMSALLADRTVDVNFSDSTPNCYVNRMFLR
jgi:putative exporter of polyketide antibiotics